MAWRTQRFRPTALDSTLPKLGKTMNSQQFANVILQMLEHISIKAARDQVKAVSDVYELLDGLAAGDLTIATVQPEPKGNPDLEE
jgi:hypothetical protein